MGGMNPMEMQQMKGMMQGMQGGAGHIIYYHILSCT